MSDIIITDQLTNRQVKLKYSEFCDIQLGLHCAVDVYEEAGKMSRVIDFKTLLNQLQED